MLLQPIEQTFLADNCRNLSSYKWEFFGCEYEITLKRKSRSRSESLNETIFQLKVFFLSHPN